MKINASSLAITTCLMLGSASAAQAAVGILCLPGKLCFTDGYGVSFQLDFATPGNTLYNSSYGNLNGFLALPVGITGLGVTLFCPVRGNYTVVEDNDPRLVQIGLYSDCFCGEGANPAHRVFQMYVNGYGQPYDEPYDPPYPMSSHAYRCTSSYEVLQSGTPDVIGPYDSNAPAYQSSSPDWLGLE